MRTRFELPSVFFSSQSHRILLHRCTQDFYVALTLTMTHHLNATRAIVPCARAQTGIGASLPVVLVSTARQCASVSFPFRWNLRLQRVILSDILILQVVSSFETHLFTLAVCDSDVTCCGGTGGLRWTVVVHMYCGEDEELVLCVRDRRRKSSNVVAEREEALLTTKHYFDVNDGRSSDES